MGLSETWDSFLAWSDEKGLPISGFAYWLEDRGIPSLPAFFLLIAVIIGLLAFLVLPSLGAGTVPSGTVTVRVADVGGLPAENVSITVSGAKNFYGTSTTSTNGIASFKKVPSGAITVTARSDAFFFEDGGRIDGEVETGKEKTISFTGTPLEITLVSIYVQVDGADNANIYLLDASGVQLQQDFGYSTEFRVTPNAQYAVRAALAGFTPVEQNATVGDQSITVKLHLTRAGETPTSRLHIGVFDSEGAEGNPIANASVTVIEKTSDKIIARLTTGQDGIADATEVPLGTALEITATAPGFLSDSKNADASSEETNVQIRLRKTGADANAVTLRVVDQTGEQISDPIIRFYERGVLKQESVPADGIAFINSTSLETLYATAYKPGFLPAAAKTLKRGENKLALTLASENNSGVVRVHVSNKNGVPESEAFVTLLDEEKQFLGIPPRVTDIDGTQTFEGIPAARLVAVASKNARSAYSEVFEVPTGADGIDVQLAFQPAKTKLQATVRNALNRNAVSNARIAIATEDGNFSCVTNAAGTCLVETLESEAAVARISASGFDDFESAPFTLAPNALNKQEFLITPTGPAAGQITFVGFFNAQGKRVNSLAPLSSYSAKFVLRSADTEFSKATAHIRIGAIETPLSEENAFITGYSSATTSATRGVSYEEALAQQPGFASANASPQTQGNAVVQLGDYGFSPPDVEIVLGDPIIFENTANTTRVITFDNPFKGAPSALTLSAGKTASLTPSETGTFTFRDAVNPDFVGTLNVAPKPAEEISVEQQGAAANEFKWVELAFQKFKGSREIVVFFKTKTRVDGTTHFEYRAAFTAAFGNETLSLRDPKDDDAGVTKPEALALAKKTTDFEINFAGECSDEQNSESGNASVCLQTGFSGDGAKSASGFDARYGGSFKISFKTLKESAKTIYVRASTDSQALELAQSSLGEVKLASAAGENKILLQDANAASTASPAPSAAAAGVQEATISVKPNAASGFFEFNAKRLSKDAAVTITLLDASNNAILEKTVYVRVVSPTMPSLKVKVRPTQANALEDNTIYFTVSDQFGTPIDNARVVLESPLLAASVEATAQETSAKSGEYSATGVNPLGVGSIDYTVEAEGFRTAGGSIAAAPPASVLDVTPAKLSLSVESREQPTAENLQVENKISNTLRVVANVVLSQTPDLVDVAISPSSLSLKAHESKQIELSAAIKDAVLQIAEKARVQRERVTGRIVLSTRVGDFSETREIPFEINAAVEQQSFEQLWSVDQANLEFELNADDKRSQTLSVTVSNAAPYPILVNQENSLSGTSVEPLSQVIEPNSQTTFQVTSRFTATEDCIFSDSTNKGSLTFYASYAGLPSKKTVALAKTVKASGKCVPPNGFRVNLPLSVTMQLPPNSLYKTNTDGSSTVKLPTQELMQFDAGASVSQTQAVVPLNTFITLASQRVSQPTSGSVNVALPMQAQYAIPADASVVQQGSSIEVRAGTFIAIFPPGTQLNAGGLGSSAAFMGSSGYYDSGTSGSTVYVGGGGLAKIAVVPPEAVVQFKTYSTLEEYTRLLGLMPAGGMEVRFPVEMLFILPTGTRVERIEASSELAVPTQLQQFSQFSSIQGYQVASLPNYDRIAFGPETVIAQLPGYGALVARVPIQTPVVFMPKYVRMGSVDFTTPVPVGVIVPTGAKFQRSKTPEGEEYLMESTAALVKFQTEPVPETKTIQNREVNQVSVAQGQKLVFLKGAEAKTALAQVEDPTEVLSCSVSFIATEDVRVDLPDSAVVTEGDNTQTASVLKCESNSRFTVKSASNGETLFESPASKKIIAQNAVVDGQVEDGKVIGDGASFQVPKGSKIDFRPCAKTSEDSKKTALVLSSASTLELPDNAQLNGLNELVLPHYALVKVVDQNGKSYSLSSTASISLDYSKTGLTADAIQKLQLPLKQGEKAKTLIAPAKTTLRFKAYCDGTTAGQIKIQSDSNTVTFESGSFVEFDFDNDKLSEEKNIFLGNTGETSIKITGLELDTRSGDPKLAEEALQVGDSNKFNFRVGYGSGQWTLTPFAKKELFFITAQVPQDAFEEGSRCIKEEYKDKPLEITAVINFQSKDLSTSAELNPKKLAVKLVISAKKECKLKKFEQTAQFLYTAFASKEDLSFKRPGHWIIITFANNWRDPITIQATDKANLIACNSLETPEFDDKGAPKQIGPQLSGYRLAPGEAKTFACKSLKTGESQLDLKLQVDKSDLTIPAKPIPIHVYDGDAALYSSSPFGVIASQTANEKTLAPACTEQYCLLPTASEAVTTFATVAIASAREELKETTLFNDFKTSKGSKQWKKVLVLQLTNSRLEANAVQKVFEALAKAQGVTAEEGASSLKQQLTGCGTYALVFRLNLGQAASSDQIDKATLDLQNVIKQADCAETPANAPLLLGGELNNIELVAGKRVVASTGEFASELLQLKKVFANPLGAFGSISTGPYGGKDAEFDSLDAVSLQSFVKTVYNADLNLKTAEGIAASRYDDSEFCVNKGGKRVGVVASALALEIAGGAIAGFFSVGGGWAFAAKAAINAAAGAGSCVGSIGVSAVKSSKTSCDAINNCLYSLIAASIPVPGGGAAQATLKTTLKSSAVALGVSAGLSSAVSAFDFSDDPSKAAFALPLVVRTTVAGPAAGTAFLDKIISSRRLNALLTESGIITKQIDEATMKTILENPETAYSRTGIALAAGKDVFDLQEVVLLNVKKSTEDQVKAIAALQAIKQANAKIAGSDAAMKTLYNRFLSDPKTISRDVPLFIRDAAKQKVALDAIGLGKKTLSERFTNAYASMKAKISKTTSQGKSALWSAAKFAIPVLLTALFNADVRPVQAIAFPKFSGHVIAYHVDESGLPTAYRFCYPNKDPTQISTAEDCDAKESFYLANACDSSNYACVLLRKLPAAQQNLAEYALFIPINAETVDPNAFFASVFVPKEKPLALKAGKAELLADLSKLQDQSKSEDQGNKAAFAEKKTTGGATGTTIESLTQTAAQAQTPAVPAPVSTAKKG